MDKQRPLISAARERLELTKKRLATATASDTSLKQEAARQVRRRRAPVTPCGGPTRGGSVRLRPGSGRSCQETDVRDIEIQLQDIAKSERMLDGAVMNRASVAVAARACRDADTHAASARPKGRLIRFLAPPPPELVKKRQGAAGVQLTDADRAEYLQKYGARAGKRCWRAIAAARLTVCAGLVSTSAAASPRA